ncbi:hypothetical protein OIV68_24380 [Burkholderia pseudomallei]|nr:hypothetical protein [Burkholderia pseudomallei]MCW0071262.1 hypothetical protein [Burkholderia pseudomallei]
MATAKEIGDKWKSKIKDLEDKRNEVNKEKDIQDYTLKNMFIDDLKSNKDERFEKFHTLDYLYG